MPRLRRPRLPERARKLTPAIEPLVLGAALPVVAAFVAGSLVYDGFEQHMRVMAITGFVLLVLDIMFIVATAAHRVGLELSNLFAQVVTDVQRRPIEIVLPDLGIAVMVRPDDEEGSEHHPGNMP